MTSSLSHNRKLKNIRFDNTFVMMFIWNRQQRKREVLPSLPYSHYSCRICFYSFRTIKTMFIFELYCKLQYTYSLITFAFIFTNISCVVVSQAVCNEWVNCLIMYFSTWKMERCLFCWKLIRLNIFFSILCLALSMDVV